MANSFPTISLCMIAKNEEQWIHQCISSVASVVSEIILVDTGSTDRTVEIAQGLGAKIFHQPWNDDFSPPRNFSIEQATSDWILVLDADEVIAQKDLAELQSLTLDSTKCYEFVQRHYSNDVRISAYTPVNGEYPEWENGHGGYFESALCRLFPNRAEIHYIGRVHELVEHRIRNIGKHQILRTRIPLHHYGHTESVKKQKQKGSLYTPLGTAKLDDNPKDWKAWFELGVEHNNNALLEESVNAFLKAIELNPSYEPTWVNIGYVLCELGRFADAETSLKSALTLDKNSHEAYCNLGVVYLRSNQLELAERCFRLAIQRSPNYINAMCNLGKSLSAQGRVSESANIYMQVLEKLPSCTSAKLELGYLYLSAKQFREAEKYFSNAVKDDPTQLQSHYLLAQVFKQTQNATRAIEELMETCRLAKEAVPSHHVTNILASAEAELVCLGVAI